MGKARRIKPQFFEQFRATVSGVSGDGQALVAETVLEDISASGLHLRLPQAVGMGAGCWSWSVVRQRTHRMDSSRTRLGELPVRGVTHARRGFGSRVARRTTESTASEVLRPSGARMDAGLNS